MKYIHLFLLLVSFNFSALAQIESFEWVKNLQADDNIYNTASQLDDQGNLFVAGKFNDSLDLDPSTGWDLLNSIDLFYSELIGSDSDGYLAKYSPEGTLLWVKQFESFGNVMINSIQFDEMQNIVIAGVFRGKVDFDPGPDSTFYTSPETNAQHAFIAKLDSVGDFLWAIEYPNSAVLSMDIDGLGNIYSTGYFHDNIDFDPSEAEFFLYLGYFISSETFILKLDGNGQFVWVKKINGSIPHPYHYNLGYHLALDNDFNIMISGNSIGPADFDPDNTNQYILGEQEAQIIYFCKLDSSGTFLWAKSIDCGLDIGPGSHLTNASSSIIDGMNNSYTAINFGDSLNINTGQETLNITSLEYGNTLILKLDSSGSYLWHKSFLSTYYGIIWDIAVDQLGDVYSTGIFGDEMDFDPGVDSFILVADSMGGAFINKLNSDGAFQWAHKITSENGNVEGLALCVDDSFEVYTSGVFAGYTDFGIGTPNQFLEGGLQYSVFIHKISQSISTVGIEEYPDPLSLNICPNPARFNVNIKCDLMNNEALYFVDLFGRKIEKLDLKGKDEISFDVSSYPSGMYFIQVEIDGKLLQSEKFIIE